MDVQIRPLADGGEGTVEALVAGMNGMKQEIQVTGPLGTPVVCEYGIIESSKTAVIEMAGAAGITLVPDEKKNPLYTTTYGVGGSNQRCDWKKAVEDLSSESEAVQRMTEVSGCCRHLDSDS